MKTPRIRECPLCGAMGVMVVLDGGGSDETGDTIRTRVCNVCGNRYQTIEVFHKQVYTSKAMREKYLQRYKDKWK